MCNNTLFRRCFVEPLITVYFFFNMEKHLNNFFFLSNKTRQWFLTSTYCEKCWELRFWRPSLNKNIYILRACIYDKFCFVQDAKGFFSLLCFNCLRDVGVRTVFAEKQSWRFHFPSNYGSYTCQQSKQLPLHSGLDWLTNTSSECGSTRFSGLAPEKKSRLFEPACSWTTRHYCGGIRCREPPGWTCLGGGVQGRLLTRCPSLLSWFLWMWRTSGSSPRTKLLTLRESLITLRRKLVLADCIRDLMPSVVPQKLTTKGESREVDLHHDRLLYHSRHWRCCPNPSVKLSIYLTTHSKINWTPPPGAGLAWALHPFPAQDHGLRFGGDPPLSSFTLSRQLLQWELWVRVR